MSTPSSSEVTEKMTELTIKGDKQYKVAGNNSLVLGNVTAHNVLQLKKLNQAVFPIVYNDKFYSEITTAGELAKLAYYNDVVVGAVCCRFDQYEEKKALYIMTLGTLAAYRRFGVGKLLLDHVIEICEKDVSIKSIYLHVQENNLTALNFYKKNGFTERGIAEKYYRLEPSDAYILVKTFRDD